MPASARQYLLLGFLVLALWQKLATGLTSQDYGFIGIVGLMLLGAVWLLSRHWP